MHILATGNVNVDILLGTLDDWPCRGTETVLPRYELRVGGALGNAVLSFRALEADVSCFGNVGNDALGEWLESNLNGPMCTLTKSPGPTAVTVGIAHGDGQRTFFSTLGHLEQFDVGKLRSFMDMAQPGDLFLICGYFVVPELRNEAEVLFSRAADRGCLTALDTGWPSDGWTPEVRAEVSALLTCVDFFLPNREEVEGLTGKSLEAGLAKLSRIVRGQTIVKLGADGAGYWQSGFLRRIPAPRVVVSDTVGAGDTFNAALMAGIQRGLPWQGAILPAVTAASLAVASSPRRYPTWAEVEAALDR